MLRRSAKGTKNISLWLENRMDKRSTSSMAGEWRICWLFGQPPWRTPIDAAFSGVVGCAARHNAERRSARPDVTHDLPWRIEKVPNPCIEAHELKNSVIPEPLPSFLRRRESRVRSPNPRRMDSRRRGNDAIFGFLVGSGSSGLGLPCVTSIKIIE